MKGLKKIGFEPFKVDESVFYKGNTIFFYYVDDSAFIDLNNYDIDKAMQELKNLKYDIDETGDIKDYIRIHFKH